MTISITEIIAGLEAKITAADSNTPVSELLQLLNAVQDVGGGAILYDSAAFLPTDSAHVGTIRLVSGTNEIRYYNGTDWAYLDSDIPEPVVPWSFQGSVSGYTTGGTPTLSDNAKTIEKFSFTSDGNATDVGDLTRRIINKGTGGSSSTDGYQLSGGNPSQVVTVDKFPFASDANAATTNNHVAHQYSSYSSSEYAAYQVAGVNPWPGGFSTNISKYEFAADTSSADVGDTATIYYNSFACVSGTDLYAYGGKNSGATTLNSIEKFPFAVEGTMTDVGNMTIARIGAAVQGQNSNTHGYAAGGYGPSASNIIEKFLFASDANATDVGDLTISSHSKQGTSSTASGYGAGGSAPSSINVIEKFPFATDGNATDVGDLSYAHAAVGAMQV